jgi:hypothetical protein
LSSLLFSLSTTFMLAIHLCTFRLLAAHRHHTPHAARALEEHNYFNFFRLWKDSPRMSGYLCDLMVCVLSAVYLLLTAGCSLQSAVCCLLFAVCCLLPAVRWLLAAVRCLLSALCRPH